MLHDGFMKHVLTQLTSQAHKLVCVIASSYLMFLNVKKISEAEISALINIKAMKIMICHRASVFSVSIISENVKKLYWWQFFNNKNLSK